MGKGVNFTPDAARRISNVVQEVENRPYPVNVSQRRRAGGLGRSTLWEVTAVQTGPGTVTIKRVSNIAFDLNDPSEKIDILYDSDNEPSVGDRGLLIRLGEGSLFFFRRGAEEPHTVVYANQYYWIRKNVPDTNYGDGTLTEIFQHTGLTDERIGIMKLERQITADDPIFNLMILRSLTVFDFYIFNWTTTSFSSMEFRLDVYKITDDFDPSAITWNSYGALAKSKISGDAALLWIRAKSDYGVTQRPDAAIRGGDRSNDWESFDLMLSNNRSYQWDLSGAYGLSLQLVGQKIAGSPNGWNGEIRFGRGDINTADSVVMSGIAREP